MLQEVRLICGIGLIIAGVTMLYINWTALTFQENSENEYDFHDLAFYGGKLCALKNFFRGLTGIFTRKHQALSPPSIGLIIGLLLISSGALLIQSLLD